MADLLDVTIFGLDTVVIKHSKENAQKGYTKTQEPFREPSVRF